MRKNLSLISIKMLKFLVNEYFSEKYGWLYQIYAERDFEGKYGPAFYGELLIISPVKHPTK